MVSSLNYNNSIVSIGLEGIKRGLNSAAINSAKETNAFVPPSEASSSGSVAGGDPDSLVSGIVGLKLDLLQVKASRSVVKVGKELDDAVLDIIA